ncbi:hypothetical protein ABZ499_23760 [Streptomyces sp. NPDC019990]|uniref:hypothetical protein n=1 Tax=Streptomyces sp. NPDC019990 TaxID=3154693 RepID=UPI0034003575
MAPRATAPGRCAARAQRVVNLNTRSPGWTRATGTERSPVTVVDQWTDFSTANPRAGTTFGFATTTPATADAPAATVTCAVKTPAA